MALPCGNITVLQEFSVGFFLFVFFKVEIISLNIKDFFVMGLGLDNRQMQIGNKSISFQKMYMNKKIKVS